LTRRIGLRPSAALAQEGALALYSSKLLKEGEGVISSESERCLRVS
jgi:hypothetical protein